MDERTIENLRKRLLEERGSLVADLRAVRLEEAESQAVSGGNVPRFTETQADAASDTQEMESDAIIAHRLSARVGEVDDALRLLDEDPGALFSCQRCGRPIAAERLTLIPGTRICAACAREEPS